MITLPPIITYLSLFPVYHADKMGVIFFNKNQ